jgi:16S rRNA (guanine527-N7)-methyltransferase
MASYLSFLDSSLQVSMRRLTSELLRWNQKINLTGHRDEKSVEVDLILDSLALAEHIQGDTLLDIGSGAGFPGLVLALAKPELKVTLLEPRGKRVSFQEHIIRTLDLKDRVQPIQGRASQDRTQDPAALEQRLFSTVTLKAVTSLEESLSLAKPYMAPGGRIVLPRGISDRQNALDLGLEVVDYQLPDPGGQRLLAIYS